MDRKPLNNGIIATLGEKYLFDYKVSTTKNVITVRTVVDY